MSREIEWDIGQFLVEYYYCTAMYCMYHGLCTAKRRYLSLQKSSSGVWMNHPCTTIKSGSTVSTLI